MHKVLEMNAKLKTLSGRIYNNWGCEAENSLPEITSERCPLALQILEHLGSLSTIQCPYLLGVSLRHKVKDRVECNTLRNGKVANKLKTSDLELLSPHLHRSKDLEKDGWATLRSIGSKASKSTQGQSGTKAPTSGTKLQELSIEDQGSCGATAQDMDLSVTVDILRSRPPKRPRYSASSPDEGMSKGTDDVRL